MDMGASFAKLNKNEESKIEFQSDKNYIGQTKDGMKNGQGMLRDDDGNLVYMGEWLNNQKCGKGVLYINKQYGVKYAYNGNFKDDKKDGLGQEFFPNGDVRYNGSWKQDKFDGKRQLL